MDDLELELAAVTAQMEDYPDSALVLTEREWQSLAGICATYLHHTDGTHTARNELAQRIIDAAVAR